MNLEKDIQKLLEVGVIDSETAKRIEEYYQKNRPDNSNRLFTIFAVLGSALVGLGIILLIAHNWDELSKPIKVVISFLPLIVGQLFVFYAFRVKSESAAWREGSAVFLTISIGAVISLISQVYNIPGNMRDFLLAWLLLALPLIFLLRSSMSNLLYIAGTTWYVWEDLLYNYHGFPWMYLLLISFSILHFLYLLKNEEKSNFVTFHHWFYPASFTISLAAIGQDHEEYLVLAYMGLFALFYQISQLKSIDHSRIRTNGWRIFGSLGMVVILLIGSFSFVYYDLFREEKMIQAIFKSPEAISSYVLILAGALVLALRKKESGSENFEIQNYIGIVFLVIFFFSLMEPVISQILCNLLLLGLGLLMIQKGNRLNHLGVLNYGLLILTALVICRFFDTNWSFIVRGLLFIALGIGFFYANYHLLQKRKKSQA